MALTPGTIAIVRDLQALESCVLGELGHRDAPTMRVRTLVVPSESLKRHWLSKIAQGCGAVIGIEVLTHLQFARRIVQKGRVPVLSYGAWLDELTRSFAADEPALAGALGQLDDGYGIAVRIVRELLDAGLTPAHGPGLLDAVGGLAGSAGIAAGVSPRVAALIRVAGRIASVAEELGVCSGPTLLRQAASHLRDCTETRALFSGAIFIGFADAVGTLGDFIESARRDAGAVVMLEAPPSVAQPNLPDIGAEFAGPFRQRFDSISPVELGRYGRMPNVGFFQGVDAFDEAQEVASRVYIALQTGTRPEAIGVVVRNMDGWVHPIAEAFREQGIPFSGVGTMRPGADNYRRYQAIADVLGEVSEVTATRWVEAMGDCDTGLLSMGFEAVGARNLREVAERLGPKLSTRSVGGFYWAEKEPKVARANLSEAVSRKIQNRASVTLDLVDNWPLEGTIEVHIQQAWQLLQDGLGWAKDSEAYALVFGVESQVPKGQVVSKDAALRFIVRAFRESGRVPIGGDGGGVAILSATEARGRTFKLLFVMGLSRGEWPRVVRDDPIFPDAARRHLRSMLPDLRERHLGVLEERFLFSQIVNGGETVWLSNARTDSSGSVQHLSSLVVELQLHGRVASEPDQPTDRQRTPWREAINRGVQGASPAEVVRVCQEGAERVQEYPAALNRRRPMNAHMGFVGPVCTGLDPRNRALYITTVEQVARCPWSAFIQRYLGVKARTNPAGSLPSLNSHLIGLAVHDVIERVVESSRVQEERSQMSAVVWPNESTLEQWAREAAERALRASGVSWTGFYRAVVPLVLGALELLRECDEFLEGVYGGEVDGSWNNEGDWPIQFRVDRVDRVDGGVMLTDFKLGKPPSVHKTEASRRRKVVESVRQGSLLQGMCYARSRPSGSGRYIFLNPEIEVPVREFRFHADDEELSAVMDSVLNEVRAVIETGCFFPRVSEAERNKRPQACSYCEVREVCPVEDSSARMALIESVSNTPSTPAERAMQDLWWRGKRES